jgi:hypothetical protein
MQINRQERLRSANRRVRRGRRTTGRIVVSALGFGVAYYGFGVAYYIDTENGRLRRKRLRQTAQRTFGNIDTVLASDVGDAPPVFDPVLHAFRAEGRDRRRAERVEAVR